MELLLFQVVINMLIKESRPAVIIFIDYTAAFDTQSQVFLDEALSNAGIAVKVRRVIQSIFHAASGCVRINMAGTVNYSDLTYHEEFFKVISSRP